MNFQGVSEVLKCKALKLRTKERTWSVALSKAEVYVT